MLVDPETLALAPGVEKLLGPEGLKTELFSCLVETNTPVCESADEARAELVRLRRQVREAAADEGLAVAGAGSHPFSRAEEQEIVAEPRYLQMLKELGPKLRRQLVCGLHVHVGMESFDACLRTLAAIVPWLPDVLALSLNSPYIAGRGDGRALVSRGPARRAAARRLSRPRSRRRRSGRPTSRRPARTTRAAGGTPARIPRLGTIEVRIADQPTDVGRSAALAALIQALCVVAPAPAEDRGTRISRGGRRPPAWGGADGRASGAGRAGGARARHLGSRRDAARAARGVPPARDGSPRRARGRRGRARGADRRMTLLRSVLYPLRLVGARLGSWSGPVVLVVLGIAAGASVVVGGRVGALVAQDRAVAQAVERIPDGSRSVRAVWFGVPGQSDEPQPVLDGAPVPRSRQVVDADARALVLFRETHDRGHLRRARRASRGSGRRWPLRSGRLPAECRPSAARCFACVAHAGGCPSRQG